MEQNAREKRERNFIATCRTTLITRKFTAPYFDRKPDADGYVRFLVDVERVHAERERKSVVANSLYFYVKEHYPYIVNSLRIDMMDNIYMSRKVSKNWNRKVADNVVKSVR